MSANAKTIIGAIPDNTTGDDFHRRAEIFPAVRRALGPEITDAEIRAVLEERWPEELS